VKDEARSVDSSRRPGLKPEELFEGEFVLAGVTFELELSANPLRTHPDKGSFESEELFEDWTVCEFPVKKGCDAGTEIGRGVDVCSVPSMTWMSMKRDWVGD